MSQLSEEFIQAARDQISRPFRQHYTRFAPCFTGVNLTSPDCLELGLDRCGEGFDCMGLAIASMCDVLGIPRGSWPVEFRHIEQLIPLAQRRPGQPGDAIILVRNGEQDHMGILTTANTIVHATNIGHRVLQEAVYPRGNESYISPEALANLPTLGLSRAA